MSKPPIFHPYTTNTGQVLLSDLVTYPRASMWLKYGGGGSGVPTSPLQIETELEESILLVYSQMDILVGMDDTTIPVLGTGSSIAPSTILLPANIYHLLQWPSKYFTPIPLTAPVTDLFIFINIISPQNSTGDTYKLDRR